MEISRGKSLWILLASLFGGIGLGFAALLVWGVGKYVLQSAPSAVDGGDDGIRPSVVEIGSLVPGFTLDALNGQQVKFDDLRGYPIMINFWASWCGPCTSEMPLLQDRYDQYGSRLLILAINASEPRQDVLDYVNLEGLTFSILLDPDGSIQDLYNIHAYPTSFFIDAEGVLQAQHIGSLSATQIDQYLRMIGVGK